MGLSNELISQFVDITNDAPESSKESTVYGTTVEFNGKIYVRLDGAPEGVLTPVTTTTALKPDERVTVMVKNHSAVVTGNITTPSARTDDVKEMGSKISEFEIIVAYRVTADDINAITATIESLKAKTAHIDNIEAVTAEIEKLEAKYASLESVSAKDVEALNADIENLRATFGEFTDLSAEELEAINADINNLRAYNADFTYVSADVLSALKADIKTLDADKLSAKEAEIKYANIDFSNIKMAAVEELFTKSGIIKDLVVGDQSITGELVGVTIKGDLIEAGTLKAEKLVVKGTDGIFYKLNIDAAGLSKEEAPTETLHGSLITAKSIVAEKIDVKDLVAFGATIGGFKIEDNSIHTVTKESVNNTTKGIYLDNDGQIAFGNADSFLKFYKDSNGEYKLEICADRMTFSSSKKTVEEEIEALRDEVATILRIESSRGTVFKNDSVSTVLSAVIYRGSERITDMAALKKAMGQSVYLQWKWQRLNEDSYGIISADDKRIGNDGFTFTLSPEDVDTKVTFICELIN